MLYALAVTLTLWLMPVWLIAAAMALDAALWLRLAACALAALWIALARPWQMLRDHRLPILFLVIKEAFSRLLK